MKLTKYQYKQKLPAEVEASLDAYIDRIKAIKWFKPSADLKRADIDSHINLALKAFGVEASIEYRRLSTFSEWNAALDTAWDAARDAAFDAARDAAFDAAFDAARDAAFDAAFDAARGAADVLALHNNEYRAKYPNGNFTLLTPVWEAGLYPVGVIGGKFVVYVPPVSSEFPSELITTNPHHP